MEVLPYEGKTIMHLPRLFFQAKIKKKIERNLCIEPAVHSSDMLVHRKMYEDKPVACSNCGVYHQSVVALKVFDIVVLLCM
jgi:hypothetical protein